MNPGDRYDACDRFVRWLDQNVSAAGRGDGVDVLDVEPSGRFWLGRLAPEEAVVELGLGDRGERLDPCACGLRLQPKPPGPWVFTTEVAARAWVRSDEKRWTKTKLVRVAFEVEVSDRPGRVGEFGGDLLAGALAEAVGTPGLRLVVTTEVVRNASGRLELTVLVVNRSPKRHDRLRDTNLYEVQLAVRDLTHQPFELAALPDSFRFDRRVAAFGVNCGVEVEGAGCRTVDTVVVDRGRPVYWSQPVAEPDFRFERLADDPLPELDRLVDAAEAWGGRRWASAVLDARASAEGWTVAMRQEADRAARAFSDECDRMRDGIDLLLDDSDLLRSFRLMNAAMRHSVGPRYDRWRPFQLGFLLANLRSLRRGEAENSIADVVWFATGGGKTETYLGLLVTAALYDRLSGKHSGVTAWSRFPLRMLSLQQTQRFADAMAGAELQRLDAGIPGDPFSVGFFVGRQATPNRIDPDPQEDWQPDPDDDDMPARYQVLLSCPFCRRRSIEMAFNRRLWKLEHRCASDHCVREERTLPFYVVDEEIYRFLPTVVVGTLDKAASISLDAAMSGLVRAPLGVCSEPGHGYVYSPRRSRPNGCLVPGCPATTRRPIRDPGRLPPTFRLQDELHLLRDSLGAVDAHYEALLDHLQVEGGGPLPKVLASSATLTGYEKQIEVLYRRRGRVFPVQGPSATESFWSCETDVLARRFVAVAPRGVTLEFAVDRMLSELQTLVRRLVTDTAQTCAEIGVDEGMAEHLLSVYGTDVVYGNTLRDLDATVRSLETQVPVAPLNTATLTGRTEFDEVRRTLERLERPEADFSERVHVVAASSMMSHGVDLDRLNVMVVLGLPLTTAEFLQATARVGRRWPGLVFVMHKIARERDAGIYRSFGPYITQGDRFVEPVAITRRSRRVLQRTAAGLELARQLALWEPRSGRALTTVRTLREYVREAEVTSRSEFEALVRALGYTDPLDELLREDLEEWLDRYFENLMDPAGSFRFPRDLSPSGGPMISLRDVEEQAPVRD